jgi:hypothetical protein
VLGKRRRRKRWLVVLDFNYWGKLGCHHKFLQLHGPIDVLLSIPDNVWCSSFDWDKSLLDCLLQISRPKSKALQILCWLMQDENHYDPVIFG